MAHHRVIYGYDEWKIAITEAEETEPDSVIIALFTGSKTAEGKSWCPDCCLGEEAIAPFLLALPNQVIFLEVDVGERTYWKDSLNPFRTDPNLGLTSIPTLVLWKKNRRLVEAQCYDQELVKMFFEESVD